MTRDYLDLFQRIRENNLYQDHKSLVVGQIHWAHCILEETYSAANCKWAFVELLDDYTDSIDDYVIRESENCAELASFAFGLFYLVTERNNNKAENFFLRRDDNGLLTDYSKDSSFLQINFLRFQDAIKNFRDVARFIALFVGKTTGYAFCPFYECFKLVPLLELLAVLVTKDVFSVVFCGSIGHPAPKKGSEDYRVCRIFSECLLIIEGLFAGDVVREL